MKTAIIIHGTEGYPEENWFPWMKEQLKAYRYETIIPQFPSPENQDPEHWWEVFQNYENLLDGESIVIGHSCGATFLLRVLEKIKVKIKAAVFVAGSIGIPPVKYIHVDEPFIKGGFDWEKIKNFAENFIAFHSEDDPYICIENGEKLAENLNTKLLRYKNAGHFNAKAGYTEFEDLMKELKSFV